MAFYRLDLLLARHFITDDIVDVAVVVDDIANVVITQDGHLAVMLQPEELGISTSQEWKTLSEMPNILRYLSRVSMLFSPLLHDLTESLTLFKRLQATISLYRPPLYIAQLVQYQWRHRGATDAIMHKAAVVFFFLKLQALIQSLDKEFVWRPVSKVIADRTVFAP